MRPSSTSALHFSSSTYAVLEEKQPANCLSNRFCANLVPTDAHCRARRDEAEWRRSGRSHKELEGKTCSNGAEKFRTHFIHNQLIPAHASLPTIYAMSLVHYTSSSDEEEEEEKVLHDVTPAKPDAVGKRALDSDESTAATTNSGTKRYLILRYSVVSKHKRRSE